MSIDDILSEGVTGPSYWGTLSKALEYAGDDGQVFRVPIERFDPDMLAFNDLLSESLNDAGEDVVRDGTWQDSLREFDSVRYDGVVEVLEEDLVEPCVALSGSR